MQFGVLRRLAFPNGKTMKNNNSARNNNKIKRLKATIQKKVDYFIFSFGLLKKEETIMQTYQFVKYITTKCAYPILELCILFW